MKSASNISSGFTLIEIVISFTISALLFTIGVTQYRQFSNNQLSKSATQNLISNLRNIQASATAGVKGSCGVFSGYEINYLDANTYKYRIFCSGTTYSSELSFPLPEGIQFYTAFTTFTFKPITGGVDSTVEIKIKNEKSGKCSKVTITSIGEIFDNSPADGLCL